MQNAITTIFMLFREKQKIFYTSNSFEFCYSWTELSLTFCCMNMELLSQMQHKIQKDVTIFFMFLQEKLKISLIRWLFFWRNIWKTRFWIFLYLRLFSFQMTILRNQFLIHYKIILNLILFTLINLYLCTWQSSH